MTLRILFWVVMAVWLIFGIGQPAVKSRKIDDSIVIWVLLALLGWVVFGAAVTK